MKKLALDYGEKNIGVAVSDPLGMTAQPRPTIKRKGDGSFLDILEEILSSEEIDLIIFGYPRNMDGSPGSLCSEIETVAQKLKERSDINVIFWDERLTTVMAEQVLLEYNFRRKKRRKEIDSLAAVLILQSYLDSLTDQ